MQGDREQANPSNPIESLLHAVAIILRHAPFAFLRSLGRKIEQNIKSRWAAGLTTFGALIAVATAVAYVIPVGKTLYDKAFGPRTTCYMFDPIAEKMTAGGAARACVADRITFIKWKDTNQYSGTRSVEETNERHWPNDRPNRTVQLYSNHETPNVWFEQDLDHVKGDVQHWNLYSHQYHVVSYAANSVVGGKIGTLLRRKDLDWPQCARGPTERRPIFEIYFNNDIVAGLKRGEQQFLYIRSAEIPCGHDPGGGEQLTLGPFSKYQQIVSAKTDRD